MQPATVTPIHPDPRPAVSPTRSAVNGTVAGAIGTTAAQLIVANNPALAPLAIPVGVAITGVLSGAGNMARNRLESGEPGAGLVLANLFAWLG